MYTYVDLDRLDVYDRLHEQIDSFRFPSDGACFGMQAIEPERGAELFWQNREASMQASHLDLQVQFRCPVMLPATNACLLSR